jgi:hypothetical protein
MRGAPGTDLIDHVQYAYGLNTLNRTIRPLVAENLLKDANLVYPSVLFDEQGSVHYSLLHPTVSHIILSI